MDGAMGACCNSLPSKFVQVDFAKVRKLVADTTNLAIVKRMIGNVLMLTQSDFKAFVWHHFGSILTAYPECLVCAASEFWMPEASRSSRCHDRSKLYFSVGTLIENEKLSYFKLFDRFFKFA